MSKHTPGPWFVAKAIDGSLCVNDHQQFESSFPIAVMGGPIDDRKANANLIAAAPDLLEVLEAYVFHGDESYVIEKAHAAIKKAKGE